MTDYQPEEALAKRMTRPGYTWLKLSLILLLGFGIRVAGLVWGQGYCQGSQGDCLEAYQVAVDCVRGDIRAQYLGQPNFSTHAKLPGPLWTLFCVEGLRLGGGSIQGALWMIVFLNTGAIYLTYLLAARTLGVTPALWAALFMAVSPSTVFFSAVVFNPVVMPFLGGLLFLALWQATQHDRSKAIFWVSFLLLMMPQFHLSGLMLIPAVVLVLILSPSRLNISWLMGGLIAGLCLYLPYILGDMAHGWENTRGMFQGSSGRYWPGTVKIVVAPLSFLVNIWTPAWTYSPAEYRNMCRACFGAFELFLAVNALSVISAGILLCGAFSRLKKDLHGLCQTPRAVFARSPGAAFLTILFAVPLLTSVPSGKVFESRYCLVLLPSLFALAGAGFTHWLESPRFRRLALIVVLTSTCATAWFMPAMYRFDYRFTRDGPRFIPDFGKLETVYQNLKAHAGKRRRVQVEDAGYLQALPPDEKLLHQAGLIRVYVSIRERQDITIPNSQPPLVTYQLRSAGKVRAEDPAVAYFGNGIALTARSPGQ